MAYISFLHMAFIHLSSTHVFLSFLAFDSTEKGQGRADKTRQEQGILCSL